MGKISGGISVSFWFVTVIALLAYWGNGAILPFLTAIVIHELSHIVAIFLCGYEIQKINFHYGGIKIEIHCDNSSLFKELLISLSGSMAGLLVASFFACMDMREFFYANLILSLFNLLPIGGLDGGKVVFEICTNASPVYGHRYAEFISWFTGTIILLIGACSFMLNLPSGGSLFLIGIVIFIASIAKNNR